MPLILGGFKEADHGHWFEYAVRPADDRPGFAASYQHLIYVGSGQDVETRVARVLKTVAHVVVDEDVDGSPVVETWQLESHRPYTTQWAVEARAKRI